ncbi:sulfotransferase family protein [Algihabitans sp.]|uniref:sulfotransferase family protein n=1 Tax=Algihabitans sp. TaxID=2821514 RepID=UPI003BAD8DCB
MTYGSETNYCPVFVFGVARSGTNLLARLVGADPTVALALDALLPLFKAWRNAIASQIPDRLDTPLTADAAFQDCYFAADGFTLLEATLEADAGRHLALTPALAEAVRARAALESPKLAEAFRNWSGDSVRTLIADAIRVAGASAEHAGSGRIRTVCIKELWTADFIPALARAFPQARFLLIHRDPRAVAASLIALSRRDESQAAHLVSYLRHWRKQVALAQHFATRSDLSHRVLAIRYEDLLADPRRTIADLGAFTGLLDLQLSPAAESSAVWRSNSSFVAVRGEIDPKAAERWRSWLDPDVVATVDYHCAPEMRLLHYLPDRPSNSVGRLTDPIRKTVVAADEAPGKWRSDSGDPAADLNWEQHRWSLLSGSEADREMVRRCFLFEQTLDAARKAQSDAMLIETRSAV